MTRRIPRAVALPAVALTFLAAAACTAAQAHEPTPAEASAQQSQDGRWTHHHDHTADPTATAPTSTASGTTGAATPSVTAPAGLPGTVAVTGTPVKNLIEAAEAAESSNYCKASKLPPGEGQANKGGTCVSTPLGEIAKHPVRVAASTRNFVNRSGKAVKVRILVADNQGPIDLNAFTHDANNKAGVTLHEFPGQLDASGRPFIHCHLGIAKLVNGFPGETYDGAFSGVQGFKGNGIVATVTGLKAGSYRGDVYCSVPGHAPLPTALANQVQAFDTFDFVVVGRR